MSGVDSGTSAGDWETLARTASLTSLGAEEETLLVRELLSFRLDGSPYALPVERVREIVRLREITEIPGVPPWVLGVVALRGEVVQVVDLRMRLGLHSGEPTKQHRIIVLHGDDERITGVLVDGVDQVLRVNEDSISASAANDAGAVSELCNRNGDFISIVDVDQVLDLRAD